MCSCKSLCDDTAKIPSAAPSGAAPCAHTGTDSPHWGKVCTHERGPKISRFHGNYKAFCWRKALEIRSLPTAFESTGSTALVQDH